MKDPIVFEIILIVELSEETLEQAAQVLVVRLLLKRQLAHILHILLESYGVPLAELFNSCIFFGAEHFSSPLLLRFVLQKLVLVCIGVFRIYSFVLGAPYVPRQLASSHEIHQDDA